jgi:hypothetical protein
MLLSLVSWSSSTGRGIGTTIALHATTTAAAGSYQAVQLIWNGPAIYGPNDALRWLRGDINVKMPRRALYATAARFDRAGQRVSPSVRSMWSMALTPSAASPDRAPRPDFRSVPAPAGDRSTRRHPHWLHRCRNRRTELPRTSTHESSVAARGALHANRTVVLDQAVDGPCPLPASPAPLPSTTGDPRERRAGDGHRETRNSRRGTTAGKPAWVESTRVVQG